MKKIFGWMRNKFNASAGGTTEPNPKSMPDHYKRDQTCTEEFFDWPNALLSIGTFGLKESENSNNVLLDVSDSNVKTTDELDVEENKKGYLRRTTSLLQRGEKNIQSDNKNSDIKKKSLTFLLKKALLCNGGYTPNPTLRDPHPLSDPILDKSRIEKILRAMLHKKIYPQKSNNNNNNNNNNNKDTSKKCLNMPENDADDEEEYQADKSKWDKTDSEYIVLEI